MLYYDKDKYEKVISEETILKIEHKMRVKCLFGGAFSTCVYGINNKGSDFDFYLLYDRKETDIESFRYFDEETLEDIYMLDWRYINESSSLYLKGIDKYPSILHRGNGKEHRLNLHRADFTSQVLFEILYSDYIWDSGFLASHTEEILKGLSYLGIVDYYFTRAWGNFHQEMLKERGRAVKYLMTFLGYGCMRWLMEYKTIPSMDISFMYKQYMPVQFVGFFDEVLEKQRSLNIERDFRMHTYDVGTHNLFGVSAQDADGSKALKEKNEVLIEKKEAVNVWMEEELQRLAGWIKSLAESGQRVSIQGGNTAFFFRSLKGT